MSDERIISTLLNLIRNGDNSERQLAFKAACALTIALETIPSEELRLELEKARDGYVAALRYDLVNRADIALVYPTYQPTRNEVTSTSFVDRLSFDSPSTDGSQ